VSSAPGRPAFLTEVVVVAEDDVFVLEARIAPGQNGDDV
jgi:hypothetical protein